MGTRSGVVPHLIQAAVFGVMVFTIAATALIPWRLASGLTAKVLGVAFRFSCGATACQRGGNGTLDFGIHRTALSASFGPGRI